jgi:hypothetical protein
VISLFAELAILKSIRLTNRALLKGSAKRYRSGERIWEIVKEERMEAGLARSSLAIGFGISFCWGTAFPYQKTFCRRANEIRVNWSEISMGELFVRRKPMV